MNWLVLTDKSYILEKVIKMRETFELPFSLIGVKIPRYEELPQIPLPEGIQITVGIPVWNRGTKPEVNPDEAIVIGCVESILDQKFPRSAYEVILVDDASSDDSWNAIVKLCEENPSFNIRGYRRPESTTFSPGAPFNIAMTQGLGWIYVFNQPDLIWPTQNFECMWRHHHAMDGLYLVPKNIGVQNVDNEAAESLINAHEWAALPSLNLKPWHFPHEWGASIRMKYLKSTRGYDEGIWVEPCDVELCCRLNLCYDILFGEDIDHITVHRHVPGIKRGGEGHENPDYVFGPGHDNKNPGGWGVPPDDVVMTPAMKEAMPCEY